MNKERIEAAGRITMEKVFSKPFTLLPEGLEPITMICPSGTELDVCNDIANRQQAGINKYGVTVQENPLSRKQWLQHAYEECLDQAIYLKRLIELEE